MRSEVSDTHPVYQGVTRQLERYNNTKRTVSEVTIYNRRKLIRGREVAGRQIPNGDGSSRIEIYAPTCGDHGNLFQKRRAERTAVHELDHADYDAEVEGGFFEDRQLSKKEYESRAVSAERKVR